MSSRLPPAHGARPFASVDRLASPLHSAAKPTKPGRAQRAEMPMIDLSATDEIADDARARSNIVRLAAAQALTGANSAVIFATGSLVGGALPPPISLPAK